jgi:hypothetical protein
LGLETGIVPPNPENISALPVVVEIIKLIPGFSYNDPMTWDLLRTKSFNYRLNNIKWVRYLDVITNSKSLNLLIVSDFKYDKIKINILPIILYVIQNETHFRVFFNTYEEYRKRGEEKDKSLINYGIIIIHYNFNIIQIRE